MLNLLQQRVEALQVLNASEIALYADAIASFCG